jgi:predicted nucleic acid-binding protein
VGVKLARLIPDGATVLLDTNPIIYMFEGHRLSERFKQIFVDIDRGRIRALTTPITLAEVMTGPMKSGDEALAERYRQALTASPGWTLRAIDADIALVAARLRIARRLKLPDAIQAAVALHEGCQALVSHDRDFGRIEGLAILQ